MKSTGLGSVYTQSKIYAINIEMTEKIPAVGSKAQVFHGTARHTSGGLTKKDLMKHKGRIISRKKHAAGKKAIKHLKALGYIAKKGTFRLMRKSMVDGRRRKTRRGGATTAPSTPSTTSTDSTGGMVSTKALSVTSYGLGKMLAGAK